MMFHDRTITALKEKYEAEQINLPDLDYLSDISTPQPLVKLIDKQSMARASQSDLNQVREERRERSGLRNIFFVSDRQEGPVVAAGRGGDIPRLH